MLSLASLSSVLNFRTLRTVDSSSLPLRYKSSASQECLFQGHPFSKGWPGTIPLQAELLSPSFPGKVQVLTLQVADWPPVQRIQESFLFLWESQLANTEGPWPSLPLIPVTLNSVLLFCSWEEDYKSCPLLTLSFLFLIPLFIYLPTYLFIYLPFWFPSFWGCPLDTALWQLCFVDYLELSVFNTWRVPTGNYFLPTWSFLHRQNMFCSCDCFRSMQTPICWVVYLLSSPKGCLCFVLGISPWTLT